VRVLPRGRPRLTPQREQVVRYDLPPVTDDGWMCAICTENTLEDLVETECGHSWHRACIEEHIAQRHPFRCPTCRQTLSTPPLLTTLELVEDEGFISDGVGGMNLGHGQEVS